MKKNIAKWLLGLSVVCTAFAFGCNPSVDSQESSPADSSPIVSAPSESIPEESPPNESAPEESSPSESAPEESSGGEKVCAHRFVKTEAKDATCTEDGNIKYYFCDFCGKYFMDETAAKEIEEADIAVAALGHSAVKMEAKEASCGEVGYIEHYFCEPCGKYFADEDAVEELAENKVLLTVGHSLTYHEAKEPNGKENGNIEYWDCPVCGGVFLDEACEAKSSLDEVTLLSVLNVPDFLVEIESGRDPVVLQLSDPQIMYTTDVENRSNQYIRETIEATNPDLILVTGDLIYGQFDTATGTIFSDYVAFMESFQIPWAPVFGNHDNECPMGVDWQCQLLENAEYCLFEQKDLTGNGNYSVGLAQDGELLRVFYMLDSNGCGAPSAASQGKVKTSAGFGQDQIDWYTSEINAIHALDADVKISFAYHIQQAVFQDAFNKYEEYDSTLVSGSSSELANPLNLDTLETADETDFGFLGRTTKSAWDTERTVFNGMKALGVDSIFVGHEHCNSASIVYEGVRFQYGQKSSTYDRYNWVFEDGSIKGGYTIPVGVHALLGGTVIPVSAEDGSIGTGYIYYCGNPFYFEPQPDPVDVNGLAITNEDLQAGYDMSVSALAFDETVNAYKIYSGGQGKVFFDTSLVGQYDYFTFTVFVPEDSEGGTAGWDFAVRVKPDGIMTTAQGCEDGKYIFYQATSSSVARKVERGKWQTFRVSLTHIDELTASATQSPEFSIMFSANSTVWLRDIAFGMLEVDDSPISVNGLQYGGVENESDLWSLADSTGTDCGTVTAVRYMNADYTTVSAYKITSTETEKNKLFINTELLRGKSTLTFTILVEEKSYTSSGSSNNEFDVRIKPDGNEIIESIPNVIDGHMSFDTNHTGETCVTLGEWMTVTIDISSFADICEEFSIVVYDGKNKTSGNANCVYVRDIILS